MATRTMKQSDVIALIAARDVVQNEMIRCYDMHADSILRDIAGFDAIRERDANEWAKLCVIKAMMSPGADLDKNISGAMAVYHAIDNIHTMADLKSVLREAKFGSGGYANATKALIHSLPTIRALTADVMTVDGLYALVNGGYLKGLAEKTIRWALVLFDARTNVLTIDRHMIRAFLAMAGNASTDELTINYGAYLACETFLLALIEETFGKETFPLVIQWAIWNESRHPGKHASHAALTIF